MTEEKENIKNEEIQGIDSDNMNPLQDEDVNTEILSENEENREQKKSRLFNKTDKKSKQQSANLLKEEIEQLKSNNAEIHDKFLRLHSEFDNYRKRTQKEKLDVIQNASESIIVSLLPIIDDMERAIKYGKETNVDLSFMEGEVLIFQKLNGLLKQKGLKEIEIEDALFNTDYHEAVGIIPALKEEDKGKIVEVVEKGYMLNDKVIRFSKVIIYQ
ncbi:MAG: nucleotide exchange factor GrpE [Bacteroidales bacterium]|jgi:molecular chaperone GrpE|nr:nucleotide exchange factor GrpE [Bacteroidales bacterium]